MVFRQRPTMPSYLRTLFLQLPFRLLSMLPTLMQLSLAILAQIMVVVEAKAIRVDFTLIPLAALLTLMLA